VWVGGFSSWLIKAKASRTVSISSRIVMRLEWIRNKQDPLDEVSSYLRAPIIQR